jgi:pimeloyl-ACP methyl ester carboxylesterase
VRIAYTDDGEGLPLVYMSQIPFSDLQLEWEMPEWRAWHQALGTGRRYIRYDGRGRGLSDRTRNECTIETEISDLSAVVDRLGLTKFDLFAGIHTGLGAITFCARYPERVRTVVFWCPYAIGDDYMTASVRQPAGAQMISDWSFFCSYLVHATLSADGDIYDNETASRLAAIYEASTTPEFAAQALETYLASDVRPLVTKVLAPALVLFDPTWNTNVPFDRVRELAASLPRGTIKVLDGQNFAPMLGSSLSTIAVIRSFLDSPVIHHATTSERVRIANTDEGKGAAEVATLQTASPGAALVLQRNGSRSERALFDGTSWILGRSIDSDIVLECPQASRYHARITSNGDRFYVEDLGSKNGTRLNGSCLTDRTELRDGDEIEVGEYVIGFHTSASQTMTITE